MPKSQPSIRSIAQEAGVSIATVSRVLNNNGRFSEETRRRVQEIIDRTGYVQNMAAKSLRSAKTKTVGLIVPDISNEWFSRLALEIESRLFERGYSLFICNTGYDPEREDACFRTLNAKMVDALVVVLRREELPAIATARGIPIVRCSSVPAAEAEHVWCVDPCNLEGSRLATQELIGAGCRRIAFVTRYHGVDPELDERFIGYREALASSGLAFDERLEQTLYDDPRDSKGACAAIGGLLDQGLDFDGVFATNDWRAYGAVQALKDRGVRVPEDVKVVGYDDISLASICDPPLTTVHQSASETAALIVDVLMAATEDGRRPQQRRPKAPVRLIRRQSTGG